MKNCSNCKWFLDCERDKTNILWIGCYNFELSEDIIIPSNEDLRDMDIKQ